MSSVERILRRLNKQFQDVPAESGWGSMDGDPLRWAGSLAGPKGSYDGSLFTLEMRFPEEYPFQAPEVFFTRPILHPDVEDCGKMTIEKFHSAWSPKITPKMVLAEICEMLQEVLPVSIEENLCHWLQFAPPFKKGNTGHFEEISMQALAFDAARNRHVLWQEALSAASRIKHGLVKTNMPGGSMGKVNFEMARTALLSEGNTISAGGAGTLVAIRRRVCPQPCAGGWL
jgi:ubiquitin-protein ligase